MVLKFPIWLLAALAFAYSQSPDQVEFFETQVRPLLARNCHGCHSSKVKSAFAGLRLDTRQGAMKGSDLGPVIVPGKSADSRLLRAIRGELTKLMPPAGKLSDADIQTVAKWIDIGAPWGKDTEASPAAGGTFDLAQRKREHWAWQPVKAVTPPVVADSKWPLQPVDNFVMAKLAGRGAKPTAPAARTAWLRRVTFDLTGLPPSIEEVKAFVEDGSPEAHQKVVDRLLESPRFGERWARRWMDLVRYSESHGSEGDPNIPRAFEYRDYLIRAFNADVPYDQFLREQIAGDLLAKPRINVKEQLNESILGVAQYRMVEHGFQPVDPWEDRVKFVDNQVDVFAKTFQGLTVSCARCHDHKFDAISQKDFYALFGILAAGRPTQLAVDAPEKLNRNREALVKLKADIKTALVAECLKSAEGVASKFVKDNPWFTPPENLLDFGKAFETAASYWRNEAMARRAFNEKHFKTVWNVGDDWVRHGAGAPPQTSLPGEFAIDAEGDRIIGGIYPAGVFSHLLSRKHNAVISSPRFKVDTDSISMRMAGDGSFAQLIIENYAVPRGGIYNQTATPKEDKMGWVRWDTAFWKGYSAYFEFATKDDVTNKDPAVKTDGGSWFGAQKIVFHSGSDAPKEDSFPMLPFFEGSAPETEVALRKRIETQLIKAITSWRDGKLNEQDAAFLDYAVRRNLLPNSLNAAESVRPLVNQYRKLEKEIQVARRAPGILEEGGKDQPLLLRGDMKRPGEPVARRYLTALDSPVYDDPKSMRLRLAEEIATPANPFTSRVMVNRIWQSLFRRGIVSTVDNFGKLGDKPVNPELLDWLANRFVEDGWSVKKMIRLLATSQTYRMGASGAEGGLDWQHMPVRRLEAEEIRDAMLAISGKLDLKMYGPSVPVYYSHETGKTKGDKPKGPMDGDGRRSVYLEIRRNATNPFLEVFDFPKPSSTRGQRDVTNVPAQALTLMNSPFVIDQSALWAKRGDDLEQMFLRAIGRKPTAAERDQCESYLAGTGKADLAQAIFNMKEFLYVQ